LSVPARFHRDLSIRAAGRHRRQAPPRHVHPSPPLDHPRPVRHSRQRPGQACPPCRTPPGVSSQRSVYSARLSQSANPFDGCLREPAASRNRETEIGNPGARRATGCSLGRSAAQPVEHEAHEQEPARAIEHLNPICVPDRIPRDSVEGILFHRDMACAIAMSVRRPIRPWMWFPVPPTLMAVPNS
jgi:hypothetical protein